MDDLRKELARDISKGDWTNTDVWDDCLVMAEHLLAAGWTKRGDDWRTLESAPKDGSSILLIADEAYTPTAFLGWWNDGWIAYSRGGEKESSGPFKMVSASHWKPLPTWSAVSTQQPPSEAASIKPVDMRAVVEALGFEPDNHHNALHCPYCNFGKPAPAAAAQEQELSEAALKAARNALAQERMKRLERLWMGDKTLGDVSEYMADARVAVEAYFAALRTQGGE